MLAGFDPGSSHCGLVIACESDAGPPSIVLARTIEVGASVPLAKPRTRQLRDGTIREVTHRRALTPEQCAEAATEILAILAEHAVTYLAIEAIDHVHLPAAVAPAAIQQIATALVRTTRLEAVVGERARAAGITVDRITRHAWIARVVPGRGEERVGRIPEAVRDGFAGWPETSDEHQRDAGGVLLGALVRTREPELARRARAAGKPAPKVDRAAAGCTCGPRGRHKRDCPLFVAPEPRGFAAWKARRAAGKV